MDYKNLKNVKFGMELEYSDVDRNTPLCEGLSWDDREQDIVNTDCRAIDPKSKTYTMGGEVNTSPTGTIDEQVRLFKKSLELLPNATVTFRSHLHLHISFEGLSEDVELQKRILLYVQNNIDDVLNHNFNPTKVEGMSTSGWKYMIIDRCKMQDWKVEHCLKAKTPKEFFDAHQMVKDGTILPQTTKRYTVNLFSIKKHGTIEYRALWMTLNPEEVKDSFRFFADFISEAVKENNTKKFIEVYNLNDYKFPPEVPYNHQQQLGWEATTTKK